MAIEFPPLFDPENLPPRADPKQLPNVNHLEVVRAAFPRIASAVELMWGTAELQQYLSNLIIDNRHYDTGVSRQGFPKEIMTSLLVIYNRHTAGAPISDIWHNAQRGSMFKKLKDRVVAKAMSASSMTKALTGNIDRDAVVAAVRGEVTEVVKITLFHYFIWMNLAFGVVGFLVGYVITAIIA